MAGLVKRIKRRLGVHDAIYDKGYYLSDVAGPAEQAAPHVAASLVEHFNLKSAYDVGCGTGAMLAALKSRGASVHGFEYSSAGLDLCRARGVPVTKFDIEHDPTPLSPAKDLVLSLEVAEHLPEQSADRFVKLLCHLAPIIACSAAAPGQAGTDHVNLQPKSYWVQKFDANGFAYDPDSAEWLAAEWSKNEIAPFYWANIMVFRQR